MFRCFVWFVCPYIILHLILFSMIQCIEIELFWVSSHVILHVLFRYRSFVSYCFSLLWFCIMSLPRVENVFLFVCSTVQRLNFICKALPCMCLCDTWHFTKPPTVYHSHVISYSVRFLSLYILSCLTLDDFVLKCKRVCIGPQAARSFPDDRRKFHKFVAFGNFSIHHTPLYVVPHVLTRVYS